MPVSTNQARVAVLADDLIWASRLVAAVSNSGASPLRSGSAEELARVLDAGEKPVAVVIDLTGRTYDGVEAVRLAAASGSPVLAVGQHEDEALRRRALAAGARRVFSYNKLFRDGPRVISALVGGRL
jgi:DNA-binding NarL/FixJ family response regulator